MIKHHLFVLARLTDTKCSQGRKQREETVGFKPTTSLVINATKQAAQSFNQDNSKSEIQTLASSQSYDKMGLTRRLDTLSDNSYNL
jgi:hypothetical protein